MPAGSLLLTLDFLGVFAFALNGALTAMSIARLDIVGVVSLAMITALGGGIVRDILLGITPPLTFRDWRYLAVATIGGLLTFAFGHHLLRIGRLIIVLDAAGLSLFAVTGAATAAGLGMGPAQAAILGVITGAGGGTIRDIMLAQIPSVLRSGLYAIPALLAATITVAAIRLDLYGLFAAIAAAGSCFSLRMLGVHYDWHAPRPPQQRHREGDN